MKFKILPGLALSAVILASCSGSVIPKNSGEKTDTPFFRIEGELPDIGEYSGKVKYHEKASETFVPSDDYGALIPFTSRIKPYSGESFGSDVIMTYSTIGLCTENGEIVLLPSDASIYYNDYYEDFPYITVTPYDEEAIEMYRPETTVIPVHGKWSITLPDGAWLTGASDGIISVISGTVPETYEYDKLVCYDFDGQKLFEKDGVIYAGNYSNGYLNIQLSGDTNPERNSCYLDKNGNVASDMYRTCNPFNKYGIAYVYEYNAHGYLINTQFEKISDVYESIYFEENCIIARNDDLVDIFRLDGTYVETVVTPRQYISVFTDGEKFVYSYYDNDKQYYKNLDGTDFVNEEGNSPNTYVSVNGYFTYLDSEENTATIFNIDGKILAKLEKCENVTAITEDERFIIWQKGSFEFDEFVNGRPLYTDPIRTVIYDTENQKELFSVPGAGGAAHNSADDKYIIIYAYDDFGVWAGDTRYYLFDTETKELVFTNCYEISRKNINGKIFYSVATEDLCTLYDEDFKKILRIINE